MPAYSEHYQWCLDRYPDFLEQRRAYYKVYMPKWRAANREKYNAYMRTYRLVETLSILASFGVHHKYLQQLKARQKRR